MTHIDFSEEKEQEESLSASAARQETSWLKNLIERNAGVTFVLCLVCFGISVVLFTTAFSAHTEVKILPYTEHGQAVDYSHGPPRIITK